MNEPHHLPHTGKHHNENCHELLPTNNKLSQKKCCRYPRCTETVHDEHDYCKKHRCGLQDCLKERMALSFFCQIHGCHSLGCNERTRIDQRACKKHQCRKHGCIAQSMVCAFFCWKHICRFPFCDNQAIDGYNYCKIHRCRRQTTHAKDLVKKIIDREGRTQPA